MDDFSPDDSCTQINKEPCTFFYFGLIVTGKGERDHLPKMFKSLSAKGVCAFKVIKRIEQLSPITSEKRKQNLKVTGGDGKILPKDVEEISIPTRTYLQKNDCNFVVLVDDLEYDRRTIAQQVYERYRLSLDRLLNEETQRRASVHFLVNMLEAYYFADSNALKNALELSTPLENYEGDVETISNPKAQMKKLYPQFNEREVADKVLGLIDMAHVLSNPNTCASLRTLFAWCVKVIKQNPSYQEFFLPDEFCLNDGVLNDITKSQTENL